MAWATPIARARVKGRGARYLALVDQFEACEPRAPATRPAPRPPLSARPSQLSVTEIKSLIRDPYAIYAKRVLHLRPLEPLAQATAPIDVNACIDTCRGRLRDDPFIFPYGISEQTGAVIPHADFDTFQLVHYNMGTKTEITARL